MSEYTPGPWQMHDEFYCHEEIYGNLDLVDGNVRGTLVCEVSENDESFANARLIAAAPDLLEACKDAADAMSRMDCGEETRMGSALKKVCDAIAKATGENL